MSGKKVFIEGVDTAVTKVFMANGYEVVNTEDSADIIVFTGGTDICPLLYKEPKGPQTHFNIERDFRCLNLFYNSQDKIRVGICRGAQFLNVMCGGSLYQHVYNHHTTHEVLDLATKEKWTMTSCHHQMMIPTVDADILLEADEETQALQTLLEMPDEFVVGLEVEACYYPEEKCFCFQPHPEYAGAPETEVWFFDYLEQIVNEFKE